MNSTMVCMLLGFITNIVLDPIMIFGLLGCPKMGMSGAAYATGIGQSVTLLAYVAALIISPLPVSFSKRNISFNKELMKKLYLVGIPASLNMALPSVLISSLNGILAAFSDKYVLVLGAYYKLQTFIYLSANGIIQGIRPLVSFNYGAGENGRVRKIFNTSLALTSGIMALGVALSFIIPDKMIGLFTENPDTVQIGVRALHIICTGFIFSAMSVTCCGVLEALGKGLESLIISFSRYAMIIIPAAYVLSKFLGAQGVFFAFPVAEGLTAVASFFIYQRLRKKELK